MIHSMRITKIEAQVFMHPDEIQKHKTINIAYDYVLEEPRLIKSKTGGKDTIGVGSSYNYAQYSTVSITVEQVDGSTPSSTTSTSTEHRANRKASRH